MRKSRFTDPQIMAVLRQAESGVAVPDLCREHGISTASFYKWRSKYGGMDASMMSQMKVLEDENRRLNAWNAQMGVGGAARGCTVIDEVDQLSDALKDQLQAFADNYRRLGTLICTTNYPEKLSEPLRNRFKNVLVRTPSASDFVQRAGQMMQAEGISLPGPVLADVMAKCDGSIRDYVDHLEDALIGARKVAASAPSSQAVPAPQSGATP